MPTTYAIPNGRTVMDATLYTGTGNVAATQSNVDLGTVGFKPDLVWMKARSIAYSNILYDSVTGTGPNGCLASDQIGAAGNNSSNCNLTAFTSTGFSTGVTAGTNILNASTQTFVAWQWQAGQGTTSNNTSGSLTSTVSVNQTAGFSIVNYTGDGAYPKTVGHGLGATPAMIIVKTRSGGTGSWITYHQSLGATQYVALDLTAAATTTSAAFNNTSPTSTVFTAGQYCNYSNGWGYVAYCWTPIPGFSAFGNYTGNGSADGPFVYTGFRPKYLLIKNTTDGGAYWGMWDSTRDPYNVDYHTLFPNVSDAEVTNTNIVDFLSNGFKIRTTATYVNTNAQNIIYAAFAENPFKYANAR